LIASVAFRGKHEDTLDTDVAVPSMCAITAGVRGQPCKPARIECALPSTALVVGSSGYRIVHAILVCSGCKVDTPWRSH